MSCWTEWENIAAILRRVTKSNS